MAMDAFLLAHSDDDVFVRPLIRRSVREGRRVLVLYLTNGAAGGRSDVGRRQAEAAAALAAAGVRGDDVIHIGAAGGIPDCDLFEHLDTAFAAAASAIDARGVPTRIVTHCWEGGHPDHDAAHVVGLALAARHGCAEASLCFPAYRAGDRGWMPFDVFAPLPANGPILPLPVGLPDILDVLWSMTYYRSQWRSFLGLGPVLAVRLLARGAIPLQPLAASSACTRPAAGPLLAETRYGRRFADCQERATAFCGRHAMISGRGA
jgi:hypothetical protein